MKIYSKIDEISIGEASNNIIDGCLALEGGAFRGVYTSGVLDCLMQHDINLKTTVGVSAGALNGLNYVSGNIGRSAICNLKHRHDSKWVGLKALKDNGGVIGFKFAFEELSNEVPFNNERFFNGHQRLVALATNLETGKQEAFDNSSNKIFDGVRASASMPFVSKPVEIGDNKYLDGGCHLKLPIRWALEQNFDKIIFVATRPADYRRKIDRKTEVINKGVYHKYPLFVDALANMNKLYNEDCDMIDKLVEEGKIFRIAPSEPVTIKRLETDVEKLGDLYWLGYNDCLKSLEDLKKYLEK